MSDLRENSVLSDEKRNELKAKLGLSSERKKKEREEFKKKVEERRAELANSSETAQEIAARVDGMREEIYQLEIKRTKESRTEERANIDRQMQELVNVLRIEESAAGISHQFKIRPKSYFRKRRIKRLVFTFSILIVIIVAALVILH